MSKDRQDEIIEGHNYDGIQELNNPLPKWWIYLFYVTIVFAVAYTAYYEILGGPSSEQELTINMNKITEKKIAMEKKVPEPVAQDVKTILSNKEELAKGKKTYTQTCAACHGQKGEGVIGPNLTDKYWLYSNGDFKGILVAIREGFPNKGMPPWKDVVPKNLHAPLAAYVMSLQGTKPVNGKAPQGKFIK